MAGGAPTSQVQAEAIARALIVDAHPGNEPKERVRLRVLWALISVDGVDFEAACQALGFTPEGARVQLGLAVRQSWWSWDDIYRLFRIVAGAGVGS